MTKTITLEKLVRLLSRLGERTAGQLGQELWSEAGLRFVNNVTATRYCRPAGKFLLEAEKRGWVKGRFDFVTKRKLWRVTDLGRAAACGAGPLKMSEK
jgi:hypothetical protein